MTMKILGSYEQLQTQMALTGIGGEWRDLGNHKQYRAEIGAIFNWWESTKTVTFQGRPAAAVRELEAALVASNSKQAVPIKIEIPINILAIVNRGA